MVNFWPNFILIFLSWFITAMAFSFGQFGLVLSLAFFLTFFLLPILRKPFRSLATWLLPLMLALLSFETNQPSFIVLIFMFLFSYLVKDFKHNQVLLFALYSYTLTAIRLVTSSHWPALAVVSLSWLFLGLVAWHYTSLKDLNQKQAGQISQLEDLLTMLKKESVAMDDHIRQEERNRLAREIHDSVGHRLTALLMQLEVARLKEDDPSTRGQLAQLKKLAQTSLYETRMAVQTMQTEEVSGIPAIIQLIRKLEIESQLNLTIKLGANVLGLSLSNDQAVAIYRTVQEALTNMMRHSQVKKAEITISLVASRDIRFQVDHPLQKPVKIKEGFGLTNIRSRLTQLNGHLTLDQSDHTFSVIGQIPLGGYIHD